MPYNRSQLVEWVQARIDELSEFDQVGAIAPHIIEQELDESAREIMNIADQQLLFPNATNKANMGFALISKLEGENNSLIYPITDSFLKLAVAKLSNWDVPIFDLGDHVSPAYTAQYFDDLKAKAFTPTCSIIPFYFAYSTGENGDTVTTFRALEMLPAMAILDNTDYRIEADTENDAELSIESNASIMGYTPIFLTGLTGQQKSPFSQFLAIEIQPAENLSGQLLDAVLWDCAGRCLTSLREPRLAEVAYMNSKKGLGSRFVPQKTGQAKLIYRPI